MSSRAAAGIAAMLAVAGLGILWPTLLSLYGLWITDPLKSIGMVVAPVSFTLVLWVWRRLDWEQDVSRRAAATGAVLLVLTAVLVHVREQSVMVLTLAPQWSLNFPPYSVVLLCYGAGVVLLFGGARLLRAAWFPVALLVFVNPVPHIFSVYVDLPLQRASAHVARAFAMALGQPLSPDRMKLMFTPQFGMFIAPGCNGIRGAVAMGLIALVVGYIYRFRWQAHALVVLAAVLLGYLFNFVRLCTLVLYYLVALHVPSLQPKGEVADYILGGTLFFIAVFLLFTVVEKLRLDSSRPIARADLRISSEHRPEDIRPAGFWLRAFIMMVLAGAGSLEVIRFMNAPSVDAAVVSDQTTMGLFPERAGTYTRTRLWNENVIGGALLFHWAEYAPAGGGARIAIGVSPMLGSHDTMICHSARGEDPIWHAQSIFRTVAQPVSFNTSLYNDGVTQYLEASTICNGSTCGEYTSPMQRFGFTWSKPTAESLLGQKADRPIPVLLKVETTDTTLAAGQARAQLSGSVATFLSAVDLDALTRPYRHY